jgi:hypothetical protein
LNLLSGGDLKSRTQNKKNTHTHWAKRDKTKRQTNKKKGIPKKARQTKDKQRKDKTNGKNKTPNML